MSQAWLESLIDWFQLKQGGVNRYWELIGFADPGNRLAASDNWDLLKANVVNVIKGRSEYRPLFRYLQSQGDPEFQRTVDSRPVRNKNKRQAVLAKEPMITYVSFL